jgi:hypothetical protein
VFFVALAFFAVLWFVFFSSDGWVTRIINATTPIHSSMGSDTGELYTSMTTFIDVWLAYFLVVTLIIFVVAGLVYVQRRKAEDYFS